MASFSSGQSHAGQAQAFPPKLTLPLLMHTEVAKLEPFHTSLAQLAAGLQVADEADVQQWLDSRLFAPYFKELRDNHEDLRRQECADKDVPVPCDQVDFKDVLNCLAFAEAAGKARFLGIVEKDDWHTVDHHAYFLQRVVQVNVEHKDGMPRNKSLALLKRQWAMWQAFRYVEASLAGSKNQRRIVGDVGGRGQGQSFSAPGGSHQLTTTGPHDKSRTVSVGADNRPKTPPDHHRPSDEDNDTRQRLPGSGYTEILDNRSQTDDNVILEDRDESFLDTTAVMLLERRSEVFDVRDRYWQDYAIHIAVGDLDDVQYQQAQTVARLRQSDLDDLNIASAQWLREYEHGFEVPLIHGPEVTASERQRLREQQEWKRTLETEILSSTAARDALGLHGDRCRIDGMPRSVSLRWFQIPAIHRLFEFAEYLTGAMLADLMGLGKTVIMIGFILETIRKRRIAEQNGGPVTAAKPHLVLVPANLVQQTLQKLYRFSLNLIIRQYPEDDRRVERYNDIKGHLKQTSEFFDTENDENARTIIVGSHSTFADRHGPSALRKWRVDNGIPDTAASNKHVVNDPDYLCPAILHERFDTIWIDEAHVLKRHDSRLNTCIQWCKPRFVGLLTATPNKNRISDSRGYLKLIQPRLPLDVLPKQRLRSGLDLPDFNPYTLAGDDPCITMRLDPGLAEKFIFSDDRTPVEAGYYMARLSEMYTVRRTYASVVDGLVIGESIPPLVRRYIDLSFSTLAQAWYDRAAERPTKELVTMDEDGNLIWNAKSFRKLVLLALWPGFQYVESYAHAEHIQDWKTNPNMLWHWLRLALEGLKADGHDAERYFELPDPEDIMTQVRVLCQLSPKLKAVLALCQDVVRFGTKKAFWTLLPAEQLLLFAVLSNLGFDVAMYSSDLMQEERDEVLREWNDEPDKCKILLLAYSMNSCGLDLQNYCHETINVDVPLSRAIRDQADHRFRRIGQTHTVYSWELAVKKTISERQINNNLNKAFANVMSEPDSSIFDIEEIQGTIEDLNVYFTIGRWAILDEKLYPMNHAVIAQAINAGKQVKELEAIDVLHQILYEEHGEWSSIEGMGPADPTDPGADINMMDAEGTGADE